MINITKGDKVVCVNDNLSCLYEGREYVVREVVYFGDYGIILEEFPSKSFYPERFVKAGETK